MGFSFTEQEHAIFNAQGQRMPGILLQATPCALPCGSVIVLQHGFLADRNAFFFRDLAHELGKFGFCTFRYDTPLVAVQSSGALQFRYADFGHDVLDLQTVIDYLAREHGLSVVGIIGHSRGGTTGLLYAGASQPQAGFAVVPRLLTSPLSCPATLHFVINVCGRFYLQAGPWHHFRRHVMHLAHALSDAQYHFPWTVAVRGKQETFAIYGHMVQAYGIEWPSMYCQRIPRSIACFTIHGSEDLVVPVADAACFDRVILNHRVIVIPGADHCFTRHAPLLFDCIRAILREACSSEKMGPSAD